MPDPVKPNVSDMNRGVADSIIGKPSAAPVGTPPPVKEVLTPDVKPVATAPVVPAMKPDTKPTGMPDIPPALLDKMRPAKKPVQKPDATQADHKDFDPDTIKLDEVDEKIRPNLGILREKWRAAERRATELEAQLKGQKPSADPEEITRLKQENEKILNDLAKLNIEADPRFKAKYQKALSPLESTAENILDSYEIKDLKPKELIAQMRGMNPRMRAEYLDSQLPDEMSPGAMAAILPLLAQMDVIEASRRGEIENSRQTAAQLEEEARQGQAHAAMQVLSSARRDAIKTVAEQEIFLQKVDGNQQWNASVDALNTRIEAVFEANDTASHARALVESAILPIYKNMFITERTRRENLENALRERNIALPSVGESSARAEGGSGRIRASMTADEAVAAVSAGMASRSRV